MEATLEDESSLADHQSSQEKSQQREFLYYLEEEFSDGDNIVSEEDLERVRALLLHRLEWNSETQRRKRERKERRHQIARSKGIKKPPTFKGKT